ncbi:MAG: PaaX family transcriptional regulator C-terminal domain-containing protein [Solirubrobacteraceae bacterium]
MQHSLRGAARGVRLAGGRIIDEQLRRRSVGAPAARSLLLTVLGEYVLPRPQGVWQETLVGALISLGYSHQAARQALARSTRDGWLVAERRGRRARMTLSGRTAELLRAGAERIYSFGRPWQWDGRWLIVVLRVPEESRAVRHQLRSRLAWTGLGSLGGGVWLTPHVEREQELAAAINDEPAADARSFVAELGRMGDPLQLVADAWALDVVRAQYEVFVEDFGRVRATSAKACFRQQTLLVHAWRRFPFLDPDLPAPLLPSGWPRQRAHDLFASRHERWRVQATEYFARLEGELDVGEERAA